MRRRDQKLFALAVGVALLLASAADAQTKFSMTGKYGARRGFLINIPLTGAAPCSRHTMRMNVFTLATTTPIMTTPPGPGFPGTGQLINPGGCVPAATATTSLGNMGASVTGSNPAGFTVPVGAFQKPLPGSLRVVPVPITAVQQLATSWGVSGPIALSSLADARNGLNQTISNEADWRKFKQSAWMSQTGRAGPNFTACWGFNNPLASGGPFGTCNYITTATRPIISKYTGGANRFGGTMTLLLQTSANVGSVAVVAAPGIPPGGVLIQPLAAAGSALGGKGYLNTRMGAPALAPLFAGFMATGSMTSGVITAVTGLITSIPLAANTAAQLPFTTGTVLVRRTGKNAGGAVSIITLTAVGNDGRSTQGKGNISLVTGNIAVSPGATTAGLEMMSLDFFVPEPSYAVMLVAGVMGLIGLSRLESRRRR